LVPGERPSRTMGEARPLAAEAAVSTSPLNQLARRFARSTTEPLSDLPDPELLDRFRVADDAAAFEALVRRHGPVVLAACRRVLSAEAAMEDAFQATFLGLLRNAGVVGRERSLGSWLFGVARRVALRARSAAAHRKVRESRTAAEHTAPPADLSWQEAC